MIHLRIGVTLTLTGPVLTQASNAGALGMDAVMSRDRNHRPLLPYSLVRGKLRQALEELQAALRPDEVKGLDQRVVTWFGKRAGRRNTDEDTGNQRGTLFFTDFVHPDPKEPDDDAAQHSGLVHRIKMSPTTGASEERMLLVIDSPFRPGEPAAFTGAVRCICPSAADVRPTIEFLRAGFRWLSQLGAERTTGFGRVQDATFDEVEVHELAPTATLGNDVSRVKQSLGSDPAAKQFEIHSCPAVPTATANFPTRYAVRIRPRGLLCLGGTRFRSNIFESETVIPGNALLGALATTLNSAMDRRSQNPVSSAGGGAWQNLVNHFSRLGFSHATPVKRGDTQRPTALPLSLVAAEPSFRDIPTQLYDVALCSRPRLVPPRADGQSTPRPPVFGSDWKEHKVTRRARDRFGWPKIPRELRVRTAVNPETLRADDERLFSYDNVAPDDIDWIGWLDLAKVADPDRALVFGELQQLCNPGIGPLGKTKVDAEFMWEDAGSIQPCVASTADPLPGNRWVVTLQTPAVLCAASDLRADSTAGASNSDAAARLLAGYGRIINELSGGALALERVFAQQSLARQHFAGRLPTDRNGNYYPHVLTTTGSTFVVAATGAGDGKRVVEDWLAHGLPLAPSLAAELGATVFDPTGDDAWQHCPFLPQHGFGEVVVNPPWLFSPQPLPTAESEWPIALEDEV